MNRESSQNFQRSGLRPHLEMRRAYQSAGCYHTHTHDEFSVGVIDAGSATYRHLQRLKTIHQTTTVMINPGEAHSCNPCVGQRWSYRMLFIDAGWMGQLQASLPDWRGSDYTPLTRSSSDTVASYHQFDDLFETLARDENPLAADEKLIQFLTTHCLGQGDGGLDKRQPEHALNKAKELLMDQLDHNVTLDAVAHVAGLSPYHLIRRFKQAYGQTPHAFQLDQRINRGKQLLKLGHSIVEVALKLGFADQSHFQRHFKKRHAITPKAYQQSL